MGRFLFFCFVFIAFPLLALSIDVKVANILCRTVFAGSLYQYDKLFSPQFIEDISEDHFRSLVHDAVEAAGQCVRSELIDEAAGTWHLISLSGNFIEVQFQLDEIHLIKKFLIKDVSLERIKISSWDDAISRLNELEGHTSFSVIPLHGEKKSLRSSEFHPLGSGFKLIVLSALADEITNGIFYWQQEFPIEEEFKSLPSGIMQKEQPGDLFSLYDYAEHMIKISDNTATDHLINIVGRHAVERQAKALTKKYAEKNLPFLTTAEMFKIKWALPLSAIHRFINATKMDRRHMLDTEVKRTSLAAVGTNNISLDKPAFVREVEWFSSTDDLCNIMKALKQKNSPEVMRALSQNAPFVPVGSGHHWKYAGFKGGSEPGVLTATYLLQDHQENWFTLAIAWHHEEKNLNSFIFFDVAKKLLLLMAKDV